MSASKNERTKTTIPADGGFGSARQRRIKFGANVLMMSIAALAVVIFLNVISFSVHWRKDLATAGTYQPSDRTKRVMEQVDKPIRLTSVYTSTQEATSRDKYLPAVQDYFDELRLFAPGKVEIAHVTSDSQKADLLARIQGKYGQQAEAHRSFIRAFEQLVQAALAEAPASQPAGAAAAEAPASQPALQTSIALLANALHEGSYLATFPRVVDLYAKVQRDLQTLGQTREEVQRLTLRTGLPRYGDAKVRISQTLDELEATLTAGQKTLQDVAGLAMVAGPEGDEFFRTAPDRLPALRKALEDLQATVGTPQDKDLPPDAREAMQAFSRQAQKAALALQEEIQRQKDLAARYPALAESTAWTVRQQVGGIFEQLIPLPKVLEAVAGQLAGVRQEIRGVLADPNLAEDQMMSAVRNLRMLAAQELEYFDIVARQLGLLGAQLGSVDRESLRFLETTGAGQWQADLLARIDALQKQMQDLPEIRLSEMSDKLDTPNAVIVETDTKVEVLSFDDVWPQAESLRTAAGEAEPRRVFNGDAAIGGAIFALARPPVATVIFVHFSSEPPPQMRQFMPPQVGSIPYQQLQALREMLTKANIVVKEWNLATDMEPPAPEEGTQPVYIFLPPPDDTSHMPGQQPPQSGFDTTHMEKVREILKGGARALFLARWEPPRRAAMPFLPPEPGTYRYDQLLEEQYGVNVQFAYRTIYGVAQTRQDNKYGVNVQRWAYMPLNTFTDHPIGKPLQSRRVLMVDVCPVEPAAKAPDGLKIAPVLEVPNRQEYWATTDVMQLFREVFSDEEGGLVSKRPNDKRSPFTAAVAVSNAKDEPVAVVLGMGASMLDGYVNERVAQIGGRDQAITFDPPPTANGDLVINAVFWLADRPDLIGAGPVVLPPVQPIAEGRLELIRAMVWLFLPGLVLSSGMLVWHVRRR